MWFQKFRDDNFNLQDKECSGQSNKIEDEKLKLKAFRSKFLSEED